VRFDIQRKNALFGNSALSEMAVAARRDADDSVETATKGCPLTAAVRALGGKWNLICLYWLVIEPRRFGQLHRLMPGISHKMLTQTLRILECEGLIIREARPGTHSAVEYQLSEHGRSAAPLMRAVRTWGREHLAFQQKSAGMSFGLGTNDVAPSDEAEVRR
jgi:DNA-binding HxlR family transcriptional regulator